MTTMSYASGRMFVDAVGGQRLDAGEDVPPALGPRAADVELAEVGVAENLPVGAQRLFEDLLPMGDEEQRRSFGRRAQRPR